MNQETRRHLQKNGPIPNKVYKAIRKHGVLTGSKVFGGWNSEKSDIDYILPPNFPYSSYDLMDMGAFYNKDYNQDDDYRSFYVLTKTGLILNLLFMHREKIYRIWETATDALTRLVKTDPWAATAMLQKKYRVLWFEMLKDILEDAYSHEIEKNGIRYRPVVPPIYDEFDDGIPF